MGELLRMLLECQHQWDMFVKTRQELTKEFSIIGLWRFGIHFLWKKPIQHTFWWMNFQSIWCQTAVIKVRTVDQILTKLLGPMHQILKQQLLVWASCAVALSGRNKRSSWLEMLTRGRLEERILSIELKVIEKWQKWRQLLQQELILG